MYVTSRSTVKLIDFNPAGGTTAPLLFGDWAQLGYGFAAAADASAASAAAPAAAAAAAGPAPAPEAASLPAAGPDAPAASGAVAAQPAAGRGNSTDGNAAAVAGADEAARRLTAASLDERTAAGADAPGSICSPVNGSGLLNGSSHANGSSARSGEGGGSSSGGPPQLPEVDFRIIVEPVVMRSAAQVGACY